MKRRRTFSAGEQSNPRSRPRIQEPDSDLPEGNEPSSDNSCLDESSQILRIGPGIQPEPEISREVLFPKKKRLEQHQYTIGWVCPLQEEARAAFLFLDEEHETHLIPDDQNCYRFGRMGVHNIVIATLPSGSYGNVSAAVVITHMTRSFQFLRCVLLVGIGAGIPSETEDINLGDVVISKPNDSYGGVVQFDFGTENANGQFITKGTMNKPPQGLLTALNHFQIESRSGRSKVAGILKEVEQRAGQRWHQYQYPGHEKDHLFPADYECTGVCSSCDRSYVDSTRWTPRSSPEPKVHYGIIASGDKLVKQPLLRDNIGQKYGAMCIEMEAAGIMNSFPCMVIRGICDYADSHKNDIWHDYAALVAAACAKCLLSYLNPTTLPHNIHQNWLRSVEGFPYINQVDHEVHAYQKDVYIKRILPQIDLALIDERHRYYLRKALDGTCKSVLDDPIFMRWRDSRVDSPLLCCFGSPGVGKSCMMSLIIEHLEQTQQRDNPRVGLAHIYCRHGDSHAHPEAFLATVTAQLILQAHISRKKMEALCCGYWATERILSDVCNAFDRIYICIDALDEMNGDCRTKLLDSFLKASTTFHIILTARDHIKSKILSQHHNSSHLTVHAKEGDIRTHIQHCINSCDTGWREVPKQIVSKIIRVSDQNFLFADQLIAFILAGTSKQDIMDRVDRIPDTIEDAYSDMIRRIRSGREGKLAMQVLTWVALSGRPLTINELQMALALEPQTAKGSPRRSSRRKFSVNEDDFTSVDIIEAICLGLVIIDGSDSTVRLFHLSFQEYFRASRPPINSPKQSLIQEGHEGLADTCLSYLEMRQIVKHSGDKAATTEDYNSQEQKGVFIFLDYAARFWGYHLRLCNQPESTCKRAAKYLQQDLSQRYTSQWHLCRNLPVRYRLTDVKSLVFSFSRTHIAAFFGLEKVMARLLDANEFDVDTIDACGATALHWAAGSGCKEGVKLLLDRGADVMIREHYSIGGGTALTRAIDSVSPNASSRTRSEKKSKMDEHTKNALAIIALLLDRGASVNYPYLNRDAFTMKKFFAPVDRRQNPELNHRVVIESDDRDMLTQSQTPLIRASQIGNVAIVKKLLKKGACIDAQSDEGWTALHWAAWQGNVDVVQLLLDRGIDRLTQNNNGHTALRLAEFRGFGAISSVLSCDTKDAADATLPGNAPDKPDWAIVQLNIFEDTSGNCPRLNTLHGATRMREDSIGQTLIKEMDTVDTGEEGSGRTPLSWAAQSGDIKMIKRLLARGAAVNSIDKHRRSPLSWAAQGGHVNAAKLLIESGGQIQPLNITSHSHLVWAAIHGRDEVVRYLLAAMGDPGMAKYHGQKALWFAAAAGRDDIISILLEHHATVECPDINRVFTPLMLAAAGGHHTVFSRLIEKGANIRHTDPAGQTCLHWACKGGHLPIVKELLTKGVDIEARDRLGRTALHWAAGRGHADVVKHLLKKGANLFHRDAKGVNALCWAAAGGHRQAVKLLLKSAGSPISDNTDTSRALRYAIQGEGQLSVHLMDREICMEGPQNPSLPVWATLKASQGAQRAFTRRAVHFDSWRILAFSKVEGTVGLIGILLDYGAAVEHTDMSGRTALSYAAERGYKRTIEACLDNGSDCCLPDNSGRTPLSWAAGSQQAGPMILPLLNPRSSTPDIQDNSGRTPLSWAAGAGNTPSVKKLLEMGADPFQPDRSGRTPLSWAIQSGERDTVTLLLTNGTYPPYSDDSGRTLLSYAAEGGDEATFQELLHHRPESNTPDRNGRTPLSWTAGQDNSHGKGCRRGKSPAEHDWVIGILEDSLGETSKKIVETLVDRADDLDLPDNSGRTALSWIAFSRHPDFVKILVEAGAEVDLPDHNGRTPLSYALEFGCPESAECLLENGANPEHIDNSNRNLMEWTIQGAPSRALAWFVNVWHKRGLNVTTSVSWNRTKVEIHYTCSCCHTLRVNESHYMCEKERDGFVLCMKCADAGIQCPGRHQLVKYRINDDEAVTQD